MSIAYVLIKAGYYTAKYGPIAFVGWGIAAHYPWWGILLGAVAVYFGTIAVTIAGAAAYGSTLGDDGE